MTAIYVNANICISKYMCMQIYVSANMCMCKYTHHIYAYIYIYISSLQFSTWYVTCLFKSL